MIPYLDLKQLNKQWQQEIEAVIIKQVRSGCYLFGEEVEAFENEWAQIVGAKYAVGTANGLDALTAILVALKFIHNWADEGEVIVSAHTFVASFEAITRAGLKPVACDVRADDYLIDAKKVETLVSDRTVALMPVHLYGRVCQMQPLRQIAAKHNLAIVADACQAHLTAKGEVLGDAAAFSFYPGKNLGALGDAGCVVTDSEQIAQFVRAFLNYGSEQKYSHIIKGINSRLDSLQAAVLRVKLRHLQQETIVRQQLARRYNELISNPLIALPYGGKDAESSNWHIYPIFCQERDALQQYLKDQGIQTLIHYPTPPHKQRAYDELNHLCLPVTERLAQTELSLPLNSTLTPAEQDSIVQALNRFNPKSSLDR